MHTAIFLGRTRRGHDSDIQDPHDAEHGQHSSISASAHHTMNELAHVVPEYLSTPLIAVGVLLSMGEYQQVAH